MLNILIPIGIAVAVLAFIVIFLCRIYRVADIDKALIITGGKEPVIKVSGGSFVVPIFRKAQYFDLSMLTVTADRDEVKTKTSVPIVIDWTAQIRPDTMNHDNLRKAIISFKERGQKGIINDIKLTLTGAVRDIVAGMTPEEVLRDKQAFAENVRETVADEMVNMGMELVSLNIQDISDQNGYYDNIAALDMEDKRQAAEKKKAVINESVRSQNAESERIASQNELAAALAVAENELQRTIRQQEVAEQQGRVEVVKQEQANLAAIKEQEVIATKAESEKKKKRIEAEADANVQTIGAEARVKVAENEASAVKIQANAQAERLKTEGDAAAAVIKQKGIAEADVTKQKGLAAAEVEKQQGLAQAEVIKQKGLAEAEVERQKLMAQAEGERALADARASNEKVNFEIEKLKLETQARITIATKTAELMADVGKNAEFVNIGGGAANGGTGNVLTDTLSSIPVLMKKLDAENTALNGKPFNDELRNLIASIAEPVKGLLSTTVNEAPKTAENTDAE